MEIIIQPTAEAASVLAAHYVAKLVRNKPSAVLGLATGQTPMALYQELIRQHREEGLDFQQVTSFNLDEYIGLGPDHPASYRYFMRENLFDQINIDQARTFVPDGLATDIPAECAAYEARIAAHGGIDLQVLGIGSDGHIGFNEPSSSLASLTRLKTLTPNTRRDNAQFFASEDDVPMHVLTMGIGSILAAKQIILLAFGEKKAEAIAAAVEGALSANVPASALQLHRTAQVFLDEAAASALQRTDYYRWVYEQKPDWQRP